MNKIIFFKLAEIANRAVPNLYRFLLFDKKMQKTVRKVVRPFFEKR